MSGAVEAIGRPVRLRDALNEPSTRGREIETAIALAMGTALTKVTRKYSMTPQDAIRGLMGNLVAVVMARTVSHAEAVEVVNEICDALKRRITEH